MIWVWLAGAGFFVTGVVGVWWTVTKTDYLPRLAVWMIKQALPIIMKRKSPEEEAAWRQAIRQGQEWNNIRRRPKEKR